MTKIRFQEWSDREISEACSFRALVDRAYQAIQTQKSGGRYAAKKWINKSRADFGRYQKAFRGEIIEALKIEDILRSRREIELVKGEREDKWDKGTYTMEQFYIKSWMGTLIPVILCSPKRLARSGSGAPAVICAHGHTMRKENLVGKKRNLIYRSHWAKDLTKIGCITISMDQWGFGERGVRPWRAFRKLERYYLPERKYAQNMLQLGRTILGLRVFDTIRQVDYLLTRDDVDPRRIGVAGLSMGGLTAATAAALDPRITLAVIAGYLNTYKDSILDLARKHCADMYTPGMLTLGEEYDLLSLIAPRPVCFVSGSKDSIFPGNSAMKAYEMIRRVYQFLGAQDNCVLDYPSMGHGWRGDVAYDFLQKKWFRGEENVSASCP